MAGKKQPYGINNIVSWGATVVIIGLLFKIQHLPFGGLFISIGLGAEAVLFFILGFQRDVEEIDWTRAYPELDPEYKGELPNASASRGIGSGVSTTAALDKMLDEADLKADYFKSLKSNFDKFGTTVTQMRDLTDVTAATGEFSQSAREAATSLGQMKDTFAGAAGTMQSFNAAAEDTAKFHTQVQALSKNLGSLNSIYEVELQDANNHLKTMNKFYGTLASASEAMSNTAQDAEAVKTQIASLNKNLTSLNSIYGNMLSAMQGR